MARQMKGSGIEWIGEIPEAWQRDKVVRIFSLIGSGTTPKSTDEEQYGGTINWIQSGDINGGVMSSCKNTITEQTLQEYSALKVYQAPFIILAMYGASVGNLSISTIDGCVNQACCVLSMSKCNFKYAFYTLKAAKEYLLQKAVGGGQPNISQDIIRSLWIPQPELEEQQRIAAFLDRKCAEIDAVIERTKTTIEEYKKLKQAVITEAVTKGVRGSRPMKDSGIEWIGEIPEAWDSSKLGGVTLSMRNGYVGPTRDLFFETGIRYIQSLHIKDGVIDFDKHPYYVAEEWANEHPKVHTNDILIVQTGDIGQVGIVEPEYDGCNCHALIIATPDCTLLSPRYLMFYLMSTPGKELLLSYKTGALLPHLNAGKIKFTPVLLPALDEQDEIVFYLDEKCAALDTLIAKKTALLTELETYKKSLIYEYVTGKKEVGA